MTNEKKKQYIMKHLSSKNRDYRFLYDYSLLRPGTVKRIEKMAKEFIESGRDSEIDLPFKFRFKFSSAERALDYMLQIQLFYRLVCVGIESTPWMQAHHCQPTKLKGADVADNLVTVPLPVHWYLHFLHGIIGEMTGNRRLEKHALNSCQIMPFEPDDLIRCGFDPVEVDRVRRAHMASRIFWSEERLRAEAAKYDSKKAFERGSRGAYDAARTRFPGLLDEIFTNQYQSWTEERIRAEAEKYDSKLAFQRGCKSAYQAALRRFPGLLDDLFGAGSITDKWDEETIKSEAAKYDSKLAFQRGCGSAYQAALKRFPGIIDELFTNQYKSWDEDQIRAIARHYPTAKTMQKCTTHGGIAAYKAAHRLGIAQTLRFQPLTIFNRAVKRRSTKFAQCHGTPKPQITNLFRPKAVDPTTSI